MTTETRTSAVNTLEATKEMIELLNELHSDLHALRESWDNTGAQEVAIARRIGAAQDAIRHGFKIAEITAQLYVGDQLHSLVALVAELAEGDEIGRKLVQHIREYNAANRPASVG